MIIRYNYARLGRRIQHLRSSSEHTCIFSQSQPRWNRITSIKRSYASEAGQDPVSPTDEDTSFPSLDSPRSVALQRALAENRNDPETSRQIESYLNRNRISMLAISFQSHPHPQQTHTRLTQRYKGHTTGSYGSEITPHYAPNDLLTNPPTPSDVSIELLLAAQTHMGHSTSLWNPSNSRYIHGIREGIHIISLDVTAAHLRRAAKIVTGVAHRGGTILFVGTRRGHDRIVVNAAQLSGACHLFERWTPGSITNGQQILGRCQAKVVDEHDREVRGFDAQLDELPVLKPDLVVCLNPLENYVMLHECGLATIPTIGIIDTDAEPTWVTYPIPANDDSLRSVAFIGGVLGRAGQEGLKMKRQDAAKGRILYPRPKGLKALHSEEEDDDRDDSNLERQRSTSAKMDIKGRNTDYSAQGTDRHLNYKASNPVAQQMDRIQANVDDLSSRQEADATAQARSDMGVKEDDDDLERELRAVEDGADDDMFDEPASADIDTSRRGSDREEKALVEESSHVR